MKTLQTAALIAATLATPATAEDEPIGPIQSVLMSSAPARLADMVTCSGAVYVLLNGDETDNVTRAFILGMMAATADHTGLGHEREDRIATVIYSASAHCKETPKAKLADILREVAESARAPAE